MMAATLAAELMSRCNPRAPEEALNAQRDLVMRAAAGDNEAFSELVRKHEAKLFNFVRLRVRHHELAEDITQEVLVKAYTNLKRLRSAEKFKSWLFSIAHNHLRDLLRRKHINEADVEESHVEVYVDEEGPQAVVEQRNRQAIVSACLAKLAPEQREALVLCDIEGMSYREIAAITRVPLGTVQSRIFYARRRMREILTKEPGFWGKEL